MGYEECDNFRLVRMTEEEAYLHRQAATVSGIGKVSISEPPTPDMPGLEGTVIVGISATSEERQELSGHITRLRRDWNTITL